MSAKTFDGRRRTSAEREARKVFSHLDAQKAMSEQGRVETDFQVNRERLKVERLAREAASKAE